MLAMSNDIAIEHPYADEAVRELEQEFYTVSNLKKLKKQLKEVKRMIKKAQDDINSWQDAGAEIGELHNYYQKLLGTKSELRSQRKEIKTYLKINELM
jgi:hypothetical protein